MCGKMLKYEFFFFFSYQLYSCSSFLTAGAGGTISQAERVLDLVATPETKKYYCISKLATHRIFNLFLHIPGLGGCF